jgi:hypothetical protein
MRGFSGVNIYVPHNYLSAADKHTHRDIRGLQALQEWRWHRLLGTWGARQTQAVDGTTEFLFIIITRITQSGTTVLRAVVSELRHTRQYAHIQR